MPAVPPTSDLTAAALDVLLENDVPGASIAVLVDGEPVVVGGVGRREMDLDAPIDADTPFLIYSVTKTLLATAALRLVDQDRIALDAPVVELLAEAPVDPSITLRQLLNHTSGLPDYGGLHDYHDAVRSAPSAPWPEDALLQRTLVQGALFAPGAGWAYSNIGYLLVKRIIARHTGGSMQEALEELVFRPAGVRGARVAETLADTRDLAPGFTTAIGDGDVVDIRGRYHPGWVSHGVVRSTARALAELIDAVFAGRLLEPGSLDAMRSAVSVPAEHPVIRMPGYGLGLMSDRDPTAHALAGHAEGGPGYSAAAFSLDASDGRRVTSVALANRDVGEVALRIAIRLANMAAGVS